MARIQLGAAQATQAKERRMLLIALGLGLLAFLLVFVFIRKVAGQRIQVLRVKETIPAGTKFSRGMFEVMGISGELAQMNKTFLNAAEAESYLGKPLAVELQPGELVTLRSFNRNVGLTPPRGKHAVPIPVPNDVDSGAYALRPGQPVNIFATYNNTTQLLRGGACVAAVGGMQTVPATADGREVRYRTVTVYVDPDEEEALLNNVHLAGDRVTLTVIGESCDATLERKAVPKLNAQPAPTPLPTPAPKKRRK